MFHGVGTLELWAISFRYSTNTCRWHSTNTCRWPSFLAILSAMLSVCRISSKISYSSTVQGRGIPLRGLRIVSRQFILTHVVNFWPKYWFITWVNPSGEYSLLGSDSLLGQNRYAKGKSSNGCLKVVTASIWADCAESSHAHILHLDVGLQDELQVTEIIFDWKHVFLTISALESPKMAFFQLYTSENAVLGLSKPELVRNACFYFELVSVTYGWA